MGRAAVGLLHEATAYHHGEVDARDDRQHGADLGATTCAPRAVRPVRQRRGRQGRGVRALHSRGSPLTPLLFPSADAPVLTPQEEDGQPVEPMHYVPILPVLLLNGSHGIGTGWSTMCWGYHPLAVYDNVLAHAEGRSMEEMVPWACGFTGEIEMGPAGGRGGPKFVSRGVARVTDEGVVVSELPIGKWTSGYKEWLQQKMADGTAGWRPLSGTPSAVSLRGTRARTAAQAAAREREGRRRRRRRGSRGASHQGAQSGGAAPSPTPTPLTRRAHYATSSLLEVIELHARSAFLYGKRKSHELAALSDEPAAEARARFITMAPR